MIELQAGTGVLTITSNPPHEPAGRTARTLAAALDEHPDRSVVLLGTGDWWFLPDHADPDEQRMLRELDARLAEHRMPVVAVLGAPVPATALGLLLGCTLRQGLAGVPVGGPGPVPPELVTRLCALGGPSLATRMALLGETVEVGAPGVDALVQPFTGAPAQVAVDVADRLARRAPLALEAMCELLRASLALPFAAGVALEADLACLLLPTGDRAEGLRAFRERREPVFHGW